MTDLECLKKVCCTAQMMAYCLVQTVIQRLNCKADLMADNSEITGLSVHMNDATYMVRVTMSATEEPSRLDCLKFAKKSANDAGELRHSSVPIR